MATASDDRATAKLNNSMLIGKDITTMANLTHLTKYPKMQQRYFIQLEDKLTEVFKVNTKQQPKEGAPLFDIITSSGNTHVFTTEVVEVIKLTQAEKNRQLAELKDKFAKGTIDHEAFATAITALI